MQAIEFDSVVKNAVIPLPDPSLLASGTAVRVVVMFEELTAENSGRLTPDAISILCANPLIIAGFAPFTRGEAHER